MRKVLLMTLVCAMLACWSAVAHQVTRKAPAKQRAAFAAAEKAKTEEAQPAADEKAKEAEAAGEKQNEPTPAAKEKAEPPVPAVKESEGTGPVAAFWFVLPER